MGQCWYGLIFSVSSGRMKGYQVKLVGDGFKTKKGFLFLATVVESLAQDIAGANFFALGLSGVWTSTWGEINEDFLVYSYHICLRKFFEWKGFGVWKTIQGSIIYVLFLLFLDICLWILMKMRYWSYLTLHLTISWSCRMWSLLTC